MKDYQQLRAIAAAVAYPDGGGLRASHWPPTTKPVLPPRDVTDDRAWVAQANCRGMDANLFIHERGASPAEVHAAKAVCAGCVVRSECLEFAIAHRERMGVWGGTTPSERRVIIRERGLPDTVPPPIEHGTAGGYTREKRLGITPCSLCLAAHARYHRERQAILKANRKLRAQEAS